MSWLRSGIMLMERLTPRLEGKDVELGLMLLNTGFHGRRGESWMGLHGTSHSLEISLSFYHIIPLPEMNR